jgi:Ca2+-binding RTX toxin-like protein
MHKRRTAFLNRALRRLGLGGGLIGVAFVAAVAALATSALTPTGDALPGRPASAAAATPNPANRFPASTSVPTTSGLPTVAMCNGKAATISGTEYSDTIYGTDGNDVIVGKGGNDHIYGLGGDDTICGGDGYDYIDGGSEIYVSHASVWGDFCDGGNHLIGPTGIRHGDEAVDCETAVNFEPE